jgi:hypothetical protein
MKIEWEECYYAGKTGDRIFTGSGAVFFDAVLFRVLYAGRETSGFNQRSS